MLEDKLSPDFYHGFFWSKENVMTVKHISCLLEYCLRNTYLSFQDRLYEQNEGAAMGSPISHNVANLFMEDLEIRALPHHHAPLHCGKGLLMIPLQSSITSHKEAFLEHFNSINDNIQFTSEEPCEDGSIPFLDMLITPDEKDRLKTTVSRKPTHTDQYLHWDSHHTLPSKYSMIGTLFHRAKTICSDPHQLQKEEQHLYKSLKRCKYPTWALNRVKLRNQEPVPKKNKGIIKNSDPNNS